MSGSPRSSSSASRHEGCQQWFVLAIARFLAQGMTIRLCESACLPLCDASAMNYVVGVSWRGVFVCEM